MSVLEMFAAVVKADDAAGAAFIDSVVYDYLCDEALAVEKDLTGMHSLVNMDRIQLAKRQLARSYVETLVEGKYPSDEIHKAAEYLAGLETYVVSVNKALEFRSRDDNSRYQLDVQRDRLGRFARKISSTPVTLTEEKFGRGTGRQLAPKVQNATDYAGGIAAMSKDPDKKAEMDKLGVLQGQYESAIQVAGELKNSLKGAKHEDVEVEMLYVRDTADGPDLVTRTFALSEFGRDSLPEGSEWGTGMNLIGMQVQAGRNAGPTTQNAVGAYNLLGEQGGSTLASLASVSPERARRLASTMGMDYKPDSSRLTRFFDRLGAGGDVLSQVTGSEKLGQSVAFVGALGPQAEQVLGPYAQRAAYRYRGTEVTPTDELLGQMRNADQLVAANPDIKSVTTDDAPVVGFYATAKRPSTNQSDGMGLTSDSLAMQVRADVASAELARTLPKDPMLARLSEASGQVLPSRGVLMDADGRVVSESIGFTDDHYLPFDLKNMGDLRGGSYARTRQSGGLTGEDIYASVVMGGRMAQVISPNGVFTLEMDPNFRGARGNSDKARSMYDRYLKILDAVDNSGQYLLDISPREKSQIREDVKQMGFDGEDAKIEVENRIEAKRRESSQIDEKDEAAADAKVRTEMGIPAEAKPTGAMARAFEENVNDEIERIRAQKTNELRLNGEGYAMAMQTLQQQFPGFIKRVEYRSLNDFAATGGKMMQGALPKGRTYATDSGYTKPGSLRAQSVGAGFYDRGPLQPEQKKLPGAKGRAAEAARLARETKENPPDTPPNEDGGDGTPAAPASTEPATRVPAERKTALNARLQSKMPQVVALRQKTMDALSSEIGNAGLEDKNNDDIPFERSLAGGKVGVAFWALDRNVNQIDSIMRNRDQALQLAIALSDRDAVETAFGKLVTSENKPGADYWKSGGTLGTNADGKPITEMAESADWVAEQAQIVADTIIMEMPFVAGNNPWHGAVGGGSPVAQAYEGMDRIQTTEQLLAFSQNEENKTTWEGARELLINRKQPGTYRTLGEIGIEASGEVAALKYLEDAKPGLQRNLAKPWDGADKAKVAAALKVANKYDESIETDVNAANISEQLLKVPAREIASQIQRSWSLAMTARLIEALDAGDVVPKGDRRLMKSARAVQVLDSSHPLSQYVAERVAKGLAPLPRPGRLVTLQRL